METEGVRDEVFQCFILRHIESECTVLCQKESPSLFGHTSAKELTKSPLRIGDECTSAAQGFVNGSYSHRCKV